MEDNEIEFKRWRLIVDLGTAFFDDFKISMEAFSDAEQVEVCSALLEIAQRFQRKEDYDDIYKTNIDPILLKYQSKCRELANRLLTDYFVQNSLKLFDLMHRQKIDDHTNTVMNDEEYKMFMQDATRLMRNHRHFTILRLPPEDQKEVFNSDLLKDEESFVAENTEFTTRRRALFLHYLNAQYNLSQDKKPLAEIAHFLTGNSEDNCMSSGQSALTSDLFKVVFFKGT